MISGADGRPFALGSLCVVAVSLSDIRWVPFVGFNSGRDAADA
jgi:hypothetical protein